MDAHFSGPDPDAGAGTDPDDALTSPIDLNAFGDELAGIDASDWAVDADIIWGAEQDMPSMDTDLGPSDDELPL
ncbi:hypothetical protein [Microbacterium sp. 179-I 3D4 NHS]|uniref:hypothetical protein n=1 Tax=Microbacterium sp. 179-I 3D4 NHS TaxID=3142381 RepID=UPI0039A3061C